MASLRLYLFIPPIGLFELHVCGAALGGRGLRTQLVVQTPGSHSYDQLCWPQLLKS